MAETQEQSVKEAERRILDLMDKVGPAALPQLIREVLNDLYIVASLYGGPVG